MVTLNTMHTPFTAGGHCFPSFSLASIYGHPDLRPVVTEGDYYRAMGWFVKLKPFFDAYLGPLQDKHRYWVGFLLLIRGVLFVVFATCDSSTVNLLAIAATMFTLLMYLAYTGHLYGKNYVNLLENSIIRKSWHSCSGNTLCQWGLSAADHIATPESIGIVLAYSNLLSSLSIRLL